jgi:hypothetical protein
MNKNPGFIAWALLATAGIAGTARAQTSPTPVPDEAAIRQAALDYMEGALTGNADRVARGVHEGLNKVEVGALPQSETQILLYNTATTLVSFVRGQAGEMYAETDKSVEVTVFDAGNDIAAARAVGAPWYDLLQLAKIDGRWKVVNVLWANRQPDAGNGTEDPAPRSEVEATVRDFIEGIYSGDQERLGRAMHPEIHKVLLRTIPETGEPFLYKMGSSAMLAATGAGMFTAPEEDWKIETEIYDISHGLAAAKVTSAQFIDQLLLGRVNGEWKVINDLWVVNPEAHPEGG